MDIMLPDLDGADTVKILRQEPKTKHIPILFLSGIAPQEDAGQAPSKDHGRRIPFSCHFPSRFPLKSCWMKLKDPRSMTPTLLRQKTLHILKIASELKVTARQVEATTSPFKKKGATIPFISRYRKETTGSLDEVAITSIRGPAQSAC